MLTIIFSTIPLQYQVRCKGDHSQLSESSPGFPIKIAKFAIRGLDFPRIDLGMMCQYILPPLLLIQLLHMDENSLVIF